MTGKSPILRLRKKLKEQPTGFKPFGHTGNGVPMFLSRKNKIVRLNPKHPYADHLMPVLKAFVDAINAFAASVSETRRPRKKRKNDKKSKAKKKRPRKSAQKRRKEKRKTLKDLPASR